MHDGWDRGEAADQLRRLATELLAGNRTGDFTKPSLGQYPHQWNWDSAFISIGLDRVSPSRAREETRSLLRGQWPSGLVPHIVYHGGSSSYFPTSEFWGSQAASGLSLGTSGLTQPPLLASAVRHHVEITGDEGMAFAEEVYPALLAWHRWLRRARDPDGKGLVAIIHPWESGTDNSSRFIEPLARLGRVEPPPYRRRDQTFVDPEERPRADDYDRFMYLIGRYRDLGWSDDLLYREAPFLVEDALFNSILHRADQDLRWLGVRLGDESTEVDSWLAATGEAIRDRLWDEADGVFYDRDVRSGELLRENTVASLAPLYSGAATDDQARRLVEGQLLDPGRYAPEGETRFYLPSVNKSSPHFEPRRYWLGPVWLNMNWLLIQGLRQYGYEELAGRIRSDTLALANRSGFAEYFDPRDGSACGATGFSWSAALVLDLLLESR